VRQTTHRNGMAVSRLRPNTMRRPQSGIESLPCLFRSLIKLLYSSSSSLLPVTTVYNRKLPDTKTTPTAFNCLNRSRKPSGRVAMHHRLALPNAAHESAALHTAAWVPISVSPATTTSSWCAGPVDPAFLHRTAGSDSFGSMTRATPRCRVCQRVRTHPEH
jgi:hypothetical protein